MSFARRLQSTARAITTGHQIIGAYAAGDNTATARVATHVGPNALLRTSAYPSPNAHPASIMAFPPPYPPTGASQYIDGSSETQPGGMCYSWPSPTQAYVYNNLKTNVGGIVPAGGAVIDGFQVDAGTYVWQFLDLSYIDLALHQGGPSVVFRGCRCRQNGSAPGIFDCGIGYTGKIMISYCDFGGLGAPADQIQEVPVKIDNCGGILIYRSYFSYFTTGVQPIAPADPNGQRDTIENYLEKITRLGGDHLDGQQVNGDQANLRYLRNYSVAQKYDDNGTIVSDTGCFSMFQDTANGQPTYYLGGGINPLDGTVGYRVTHNYVGGNGYCFYLNSGPAPGNDLYFANNLITTSIYPIGYTADGEQGYGGGYDGPVDSAPVWNQAGNYQENNLWADGPTAGTSFI